MSYFRVGITAIYQMIHTLNNPETAKACFTVHIHNCLIILPSTIDSQVRAHRSITTSLR